MIEPVILLDMDGVLSDFVSSVSRISPNPHDVYNKSESKRMFGNSEGSPLEEEFSFDSVNEMWKTIDAGGVDFWANIPAYPWAKHLIDVLSEFKARIVVCTSPSLSENSAAGKVIWLKKFFETENFRDYMITPAKWAAASENTFLIDDHEGLIEKFKNRGGNGALWPAPWNRLHNRYSRNGMFQIEYILGPLKEWYDRVTRVVDRADLIHG